MSTAEMQHLDRLRQLGEFEQESNTDAVHVQGMNRCAALQTESVNVQGELCHPAAL